MARAAAWPRRASRSSRSAASTACLAASRLYRACKTRAQLVAQGAEPCAPYFCRGHTTPGVQGVSQSRRPCANACERPGPGLGRKTRYPRGAARPRLTVPRTLRLTYTFSRFGYIVKYPIAASSWQAGIPLVWDRPVYMDTFSSAHMHSLRVTPVGCLDACPQGSPGGSRSEATCVL